MAENITPVYLARQPIYDTSHHVFGYELLYRRAPNESLGDMSAPEAARALVNALVDIGLNDLVYSAKAFINVTEEMIASRALEAFPKDRVIIEVLEHVRPTDEVHVELKRLKKLGYRIALDDFILTDHTEQLLPYASIVKVDLFQHAFGDLAELVRKLRAEGKMVLAEKIETHEEQRACREIGFELFQGYYMSKPEIVEGRAIASNHMALVRLLSRMNAADLTFDELEDIVCSDVQLNVRILKFIKSAFLGLPGKVDSIRKALLFVGMNTLAAVATLLMMSRFSHKPTELIHIAMVRAKMAEAIGARLGCMDLDRHFTVGLLSVLDALMDLPMPELLAQLPLSEEIEQALLNPDGDGDLARSLRIVTAYERGDFDAVAEEHMPIDVASSAYRKALTWATHAQGALAA